MSFFSKFAKGTRSRFNRGRPAAPAPGLPNTVPEPPVPERPTPNKAAEHDKKAESDKPLDDTLVPPEQPVRDKLHKPENKALEGQSSTEPHTQSDSIGAEGIFMNMWRPEASYRMIAEEQPETNFYVPNSIPMFSLLEEAEARINASKHIQEHEPNYLPYAVKVYYAILYYVQIMRARRESGHITGYENSFLKRFETAYPANGLPVAEIVYGYFSTIISTELAEAKYDWIVPRTAIEQIVEDATTHRFPTINYGDITNTNAALFLQPHVPMMMAFLNSFIHQTPATLADHIEDTDTYIPVELGTAVNHHAANILNKDIVSNTNANNNIKIGMRCAGASSPFRFGNSNYPSAARAARRTDFGRSIKLVTSQTDMDTTTGLSNNLTFQGIDGFLFMEKTSNLKFFKFLKDQATIHARFFDKVYHLHEVQTVGGLETTIICQLKLDRSHTARQYTDTLTGYANEIHWFTNPMHNLIGGFATNRAGVRRNEELQAFTYATVCHLPIANIDLYNGQGPFWDNREWIQTLFMDYAAGTNNPIGATLTRQGKPMYAHHSSNVLRCYREKPHGTGVVDNEF